MTESVFELVLTVELGRGGNGKHNSMLRDRIRTDMQTENQKYFVERELGVI